MSFPYLRGGFHRLRRDGSPRGGGDQNVNVNQNHRLLSSRNSLYPATMITRSRGSTPNFGNRFVDSSIASIGNVSSSSLSAMTNRDSNLRPFAQTFPPRASNQATFNSHRNDRYNMRQQIHRDKRSSIEKYGGSETNAVHQNDINSTRTSPDGGKYFVQFFF
ncbi:unnamed protein product [Anisakis simplex]|uniref:Uncharacterized protein n=1 Tax=Anisakis simplex TaxID=6269 RepID=A0A3P6R1T2_ANISI|nr:unnamed protein product [Anisakis simplex]